jgi:diguanylate cyclase (GGDEF)-like protein
VRVSDATGQRGGADPGARRVVGLTIALVAVFAALLPLVGGQSARSPVAWEAAFAVGALFVAGEALLIHVPTRRDMHTASFSEVPVILGLFLLPPAQFFVAGVTGTVLALWFHRKQRGMKLVFNVVEIAMQLMLATIVFRALSGDGAVLSPRAFAAAIVAALVADLVSAVLVNAAIGLYRGSWPGLGAYEIFQGSVATAAKSALALLGVFAVLERNVLAAAMVVVCATTMYLVFRAYASLHAHHRRLEMLYRFMSAVAGSVQLDAIAEAAVTEARELLRAARAELWLETPAGALIVWRADADAPRVARLADRNTQDTRWQDVVVQGGRVTEGEHLAYPLTMRSGRRGFLAVDERRGVEGAFDAVDVRLFEALVSQAAIALENGALVEQLETEMREREHRATHDPLTGLANRMQFSELLDGSLLRDGARRALFVLGLDRFSDVNETLGHDNGDVVLASLADRLRVAIPGSTAARLGGDEFAVLTAPLAPDEELRALCDELLAAVTSRITIDGLHLEIGATIGVSVAPEHGTDALSLLRGADTAMRHAKARRTGFEIYAGGGDRDTRRRLGLAHQLRQAIDGGELTVYYQPKIELGSGWPVGVEALVRWNHPEHGFLPPDEFIPVAERTGFIEPLTALVLDTALSQRRVWAEAGLELTVAVNVSARSLGDRALADRVTRALVRNRCPSDALTIEITETQLMADPVRAADALNELHGLGVRVSIDDFGTGFSSLSSLRALPLDEVKIDKSFVLSATQNPSDAAIVRSMTTLGRSLGLHVTAEGVEDEATLAFLAECGAHTAQGFYFSKPMPPDQIEAWLRQRITSGVGQR